MYTGHIGIALAVRGQKTNLPMWLLLLSTQGCDWVETLILWSRWTTETSLWSHSLPAVAAGTVAIAILGGVVTHSRSGAIWCAAIYISHLLVDYITGLKPAWGGGPYIGMRLYRVPIADFLLESLFVIGGILLYNRSLPPPKRGNYRLYLLMVLLLAVQGMNDLLMGWLQKSEAV